MRTAPAHVPSQVDRNITRVIDVLLKFREQTLNELILASGISKSTMMRRRSHGGWSAEEVQQLADHFDVPVSVMYEGPDALLAVPFRVTGGKAAKVRDLSPAANWALTGQAA